jgi:hypothetical protein
VDKAWITPTGQSEKVEGSELREATPDEKLVEVVCVGQEGRLVCEKNGLAVAETRKNRLRLAECRGYVIVSAKKPVSCIYSA